MRKNIIKGIVIMGIISQIMSVFSCKNNEIKDEHAIRKQKSELFLKKIDVPICKNLPYIESESECKIRTVEEIVHRIYVLYALALIGHGVDKKELIQDLKSNGLYEFLTPDESIYIKTEKRTMKQDVKFAWRIESIYILLWSIGKIESLPLPIAECDPRKTQAIIGKFKNYKNLIKTSALRSKAEILDKSDLIYRMHWAVRDARISNMESPGNLNPDVVYEWHYAINWLTYYADDWDDITTDT